MDEIDQNDSVPKRDGKSFKKMEVTYSKIFCSIFSICSYILDISLDIYVAVRHYNDGKETYFILTVLFIVLPAVFMTAFSVRWYIIDSATERFRVSPTHWILRILFLTLFMAPALRNAEALYYAKRSSKSESIADKENYARRMVYENTDASFLRLFEALMECAPQLILQIYIFAQGYYDEPRDISFTEIIQLICIFTSLVSMTTAIVSYSRHLRESLDYKNELSCSISTFPILWRFFDITARVVALGLFASILLPYFFLLCGLHFCGMLVWIRCMKTDFCDNNKYAEFVYNMILAFMLIFCFFNPKDDNTRVRYTVYYFIIFVENTVFISIWYHHDLPGYRLPVLIMVFVCFTLALITMVFYYILLHPTRGTLFMKPDPKISDVRPRSQSNAGQFKELIDRTGRGMEMLEEKPNATIQNGKSAEIKSEGEQMTVC